MIIEKNTPKRSRAVPIFLTLLLFLTSLAFFLLSALSSGRLSLFFRLSAPFFLLIGMLFSGRFLLYDYTYILTDSELLIERHGRLDRRTECRVYLNEIEDIFVYKNKKKTIGDVRLHRYYPSPFPKKTYCVVFDIDGTREAVLIDADAFFIKALERHSVNSSSDIFLN